MKTKQLRMILFASLCVVVLIASCAQAQKPKHL